MTVLLSGNNLALHRAPYGKGPPQGGYCFSYSRVIVEAVIKESLNLGLFALYHHL